MPGFPGDFTDLASVTASTKFLADNGTVNGLGSAAQLKNYMFQSGTLTASAPLELTQTWNAAGVTFTASCVNVTDTASAAGSRLFALRVGGVDRLSIGKNAAMVLTGTESAISVHWPGETNTSLQQGGLFTNSAGMVCWSSSGTSHLPGRDTSLRRRAAGVVGVRGAVDTTGGAMNFLEQTAPAAPATNEVVIYAEDNGAGKTRLMARFATGAAQQIAIEP